MALSVVMVAISLSLAAFVLHGLFVINLERSATSDLDASLTRLVALIDPRTDTPSITGTLPDPRYETPLGGRYWQIELIDNGSMASSRSLFDQRLDIGTNGDGALHLTGNDGLHLLAVSRTVEIEGRTYRIVVGEDHERIHAAGQQYAWDIGKLFALLSVVILGITWAQLQLGLLPLSRLRKAVDEVRQGEVGKLRGPFPSEVWPLVEEVNGLLEEREALAQRARSRASDLAHGLKTPLAAVNGIAMQLREAGRERDAQALDDLAIEMSERVDYQMRLAALRARTIEHRESSSLNAAILRTMAVLRKTEVGETLHWQVELPDDINVDIHRQDLMELVGVALENAAKWTTTMVKVRTKRLGETVILDIGDDGPGIAPELVEKLGHRGVRLDENVPGTGLGLAIVSEILELNRGQIEYLRSEAGGLLVRMHLPLAAK